MALNPDHSQILAHGHTSKTCEQKQALIDSAIGRTTNAIYTIVSRSTHDDFRLACFQKLQVCDVHELSSSITHRLEMIAAQRMGYTPQQDMHSDKKWKRNLPPGQSEEKQQAEPDIHTCSSADTELKTNQALDDADVEFLDLDKDFNIFTEEEMKEMTSLLQPNTGLAQEVEEQLPFQQKVCEVSTEKTSLPVEDLTQVSEHAQTNSIIANTQTENNDDDDWFEEMLLECDWMTEDGPI